jgi:hypothetical protein
MKIIFTVLLFLFVQFSFAQKLNINSLETITYSSVTKADSLLKRFNFFLSDKQTGKDYNNYYYTSYERRDLFKHLLRSLSFMDVYSGKDTSRLVLYRTYYEDEQEELKKQLIAGGYQLQNRKGNDFVYKKGELTITNKISEKNMNRGKPMIAYEFELGR